jgi:hypothetical protein
MYFFVALISDELPHAFPSILRKHEGLKKRIQRVTIRFLERNNFFEEHERLFEGSTSDRKRARRIIDGSTWGAECMTGFLLKALLGEASDALSNLKAAKIPHSKLSLTFSLPRKRAASQATSSRAFKCLR